MFMKKLNLLKLTLAILSVFIFINTSQLEAATATVENTQITESQDLKNIIKKYHKNEQTKLSKIEIKTLNSYLLDSTNQNFKNFSSKERASLARIVFLHESEFKSTDIRKFNNDQKLLSGVNVQEIHKLNLIVTRIKNKDTLDSNEVLFIKKLEPTIAKNPTSFIPELKFITPYASLHQGPNSNSFSSKDLDSLRKSTRHAAGINDNLDQKLRHIATKSDPSLSKDEIKALETMMYRSPISGLNDAEAGIQFANKKKIETNSQFFDKESIKKFNKSFKENPEIAAAFATNIRPKTNTAPTENFTDEKDEGEEFDRSSRRN